MHLKHGFIFSLVWLATLVLSATAAWAEEISDPPKKPQATKKKQIKKPSRGNWNVGLLYNTASKLVYGGNVTMLTGTVRFVVTNQSRGALGFSGGYLYTQPWGLGYGMDLMVELPRSSEGISGTAGNAQVSGTLDGNPTISLITLNANGNFGFGNTVYAILGFNYPFVFSSDPSLQVSGLIGYQGGIGIVITDAFRAELEYRLSAMKGRMKSAGMEFDITEADFAGALLLVRYSF